MLVALAFGLCLTRPKPTQLEQGFKGHEADLLALWRPEVAAQRLKQAGLELVVPHQLTDLVHLTLIVHLHDKVAKAPDGLLLNFFFAAAAGHGDVCQDTALDDYLAVLGRVEHDVANDPDSGNDLVPWLLCNGKLQLGHQLKLGCALRDDQRAEVVALADQVTQDLQRLPVVLVAAAAEDQGDCLAQFEGCSRELERLLLREQVKRVLHHAQKVLPELVDQTAVLLVGLHEQRVEMAVEELRQEVEEGLCIDLVHVFKRLERRNDPTQDPYAYAPGLKRELFVEGLCDHVNLVG